MDETSPASMQTGFLVNLNRSTLIDRFTAFLDSLESNDILVLKKNWDTKVALALKWAATYPDIITIEVNESDRGQLPKNWRPIQNWKEGTCGARAFTYEPVHTIDEIGSVMTIAELLCRARVADCDGTLMDANALARFLNEHPVKAKELKRLFFIFSLAVAIDSVGDRMVAVVCNTSDFWAVTWCSVQYTRCNYNYRPVRFESTG